MFGTRRGRQVFSLCRIGLVVLYDLYDMICLVCVFAFVNFFSLKEVVTKKLDRGRCGGSPSQRFSFLVVTPMAHHSQIE